MCIASDRNCRTRAPVTRGHESDGDRQVVAAAGGGGRDEGLQARARGGRALCRSTQGRAFHQGIV